MKMNKLIISEDVERALEEFADMGDGLEEFANYKEDFNHQYKPLKDFTVEQMALLLCGWYEVEKPFKAGAGDWIYREKGDAYYKVKDVEDGRCYLVLSQKEISEGIILKVPKDLSEWAKVEEPWKIALLEAGRKKPELKKGDIVRTKRNSIWIVSDFDSKGTSYEIEQWEIEFVYPIEGRINLKGGNNNE